MKTAEIKRRFLAHFEANGHTVVPSAPLPAIDDPNLLFINAGMVQFVPFFLGQRTPPYSRAVSVQKCLRTPDIDEVGKTSRHGTFFQMNGNFSFGDYFKEEAIPLAWELITNPVEQGGFGLDPEKIWATVYLDDDEAIDIWRRTGLPLERIVRRGKADNFWSMGIPGPCGPCSEIYYDRGPAYGREGGPAVDEDRYMEIWNNVFMQFERGPGTDKEDYPILGELPAKNIDTGMGLERMAAILQGVDNLYEIDEVRPILDKAVELTGQPLRRQPVARGVRVAPRRRAAAGDRGPRPHRPDADHRRGDAEQRGPRLRAAPHPAPGDPVDPAARLRGAGAAVAAAGGPGLHGAVLPRGRHRLRAHLDRTPTARRRRSCPRCGRARPSSTWRSRTRRRRAAPALAGDKAFQLHDTYGFPIDLTLEIAAEQGLQVDQDGFRRLMTEQRKRAKADAQARKTGHVDLSAYRSVLDAGGPVDFTGYAEASARVAAARAAVRVGQPAGRGGRG